MNNLNKENSTVESPCAKTMSCILNGAFSTGTDRVNITFDLIS